MWQPEPGWQRLPGAPARRPYGVWSATQHGHDVVVKRLRRRRAAATRPASSTRATSTTGERAADVALHGVVVRRTAACARRPSVRVDEDDEGITLVHERVETDDPRACGWLACLGRFAARRPAGRTPWLARDQLRSRLRLVERRGGWRTLARTPMADIADHLWTRREAWLDRCDAAPAGGPARRPVGRQHPRAARRRRRRHRLGPPRPGTGRAPTSATCRWRPARTSSPCSRRTSTALPAGLARPEDVVTGARVTAVYTALTRLDWALRPGRGRRGRAGRQVPPPQRGAVHPLDAAPGRSDRGAARDR